MCGICGIVHISGKPVEESEIDSMVGVMNHRGPDDRGKFIENNIGLGHTRLSIIDLSILGHQPMQHDDVVITYNGEVYNFSEIRKSLEEIGYHFESNSDTEVMIKAYREWGIDAIHKFNGMFAFGLFDRRKNIFFLVRDRFGVKPLYYSLSHKDLIFASTVRAIHQNRKITQLSKNAINDYLNFLYIPGAQSIYQDVQRLLPGHYLKINLSSNDIVIKKYYQVSVVERNDSPELELKRIEDLLMSSVQYRMISDVPVGIFLSGGVDSSLVCALAASQTEKKLNTFSIGYGADGKFFDETKYALAVSNRYHTNHTRFEVDLNQVFADFDEIVSNLDEPNADTSVFLNYYISKLARKHVTVALSGVGGDELYGGYNRYQAFLIGKKISHLPYGVKEMLSVIFSKLGGRRSGTLSNALRAFNKLLDSVHQDPAQFYGRLISYTQNEAGTLEFLGDPKNLNVWMKYDIERYLPDDLLSLTDQMSMAHSLEVREPFLDFRVVEDAMRIPAAKKVNLFQKKIGLKKLAEKYIDKEIIYRRKQGFSAPIEPWLKKSRPDELGKQFSSGPLHDFIPASYTSSIVNGFYSENKDLSLQLYAIVLLNKWLSLNLN